VSALIIASAWGDAARRRRVSLFARPRSQR
jgi:hypothetical protein